MAIMRNVFDIAAITDELRSYVSQAYYEEKLQMHDFLNFYDRGCFTLHSCYVGRCLLS